MTEELHALFFNRWNPNMDDLMTKWCGEAAMAIANMDELQKTEWRNQMAKIALEAKVKTSYADEDLRKTKAEKVKAGKPWLVPSETNPDMQVVKTRQTRMSKMEKLLADMKSLGVEGADDIIKSVAKNENPAVSSAPTRTLFDKGNNGTTATVKTHNTQESLLSDVCDSIIAGINYRPIEDLYNASVTAGHIANRLLRPLVVVSEVAKDEPFDFSKLGD